MVNLLAFNRFTKKLPDTPYPIDPFTFVSSCLEDYRSHQRNVPANTVTSDGVFVVPALPPRLTPASTTSNPPVPPPQLATGGPISKRAIAALKSPFPDAHILVVINKINQLHASSLTALVEAIYQDLREHKVTKLAIEGKVREIGEKCRDKKIWVVKPDLMPV
jgi:chromatin assembly factor 1 subunit A